MLSKKKAGNVWSFFGGHYQSYGLNSDYSVFTTVVFSIWKCWTGSNEK